MMRRPLVWACAWTIALSAVELRAGETDVEDPAGAVEEAVPAAPARTLDLDAASPTWSAYLDFAYVYSSADAKTLRARLVEYGAEAGIPLERYIEEYFETLAPLEPHMDEADTRRKAVAYLLDYLAHGRPESLDHAASVIRVLRERLERPENRFWYHYIRAHLALEKGYAQDFSDELLAMWLHVVVPLESLYETLDALALSDAPNSGFVAALPFLYENLTRLILIRSQEMGLERELDPLGALVRMLVDGRVGGQPDVIPSEATSSDYLERIVERLEGPESDDGSLTFTLALFEATRRHERARALLAERGLGEETVRAMRAAASGYETALKRAATVQGECAVYTRVLRQLGELYAARQRLGVDPEIELPFSIEGAIAVYARMSGALGGGWERLGYRIHPRSDYVHATQRLWEEIQEASLNAADYYLTRAVEEPHRADEHSRNAAHLYTRYLSFFRRFATDESKEGVPDSAYFAAFEAARGVGDAYLAYAKQASATEVELGTQRYHLALFLFPFDREVWPALTAALGRHGQEARYADLVRPIAERVARSAAVQSWIASGEPHGAEIAALRRALSDGLVLMYMGFAEASGLAELERDLEELVARRAELERTVTELRGRVESLRYGGSPPAAPAPNADEARGLARLELAEVARELAETSALLARVEEQIEARSRALPVYKETLATGGFVQALRTRRDHPVHALLRRMYHEARF